MIFAVLFVAVLVLWCLVVHVLDELEPWNGWDNKGAGKYHRDHYENSNSYWDFED